MGLDCNVKSSVLVFFFNVRVRGVYGKGATFYYFLPSF